MTARRIFFQVHKSIAWPADQQAEWRIGFWRLGSSAEVKVADATAEVTPPSPPKAETLARTMRRWHDGTGMGPLWQIVIFIGGIIPVLLAVTGILMWWNSRRWRGESAQRKRARATVPAE